MNESLRNAYRQNDTAGRTERAKLRIHDFREDEGAERLLARMAADPAFDATIAPSQRVALGHYVEAKARAAQARDQLGGDAA